MGVQIAHDFGGSQSPEHDPYQETPPETDWERLGRMAARRFHGYTRDDLDHLPPPDPLISGVLPRRGLAMLAGSRGLGKSLLALSIAGAVSAGQPAWYGQDVAHHGPVLYVSLEGFHGVPERVRAWEAVHGPRTEHITWVSEAVDLKKSLDAQMVAAYAKDLGATLIVVDSARASGAGAEDTKDMGHYVLGLETIRDHSEALILVLHNTGWDGTRERGSTLLPDACDTTLLLEGDPETVRTLKHRKHRDGDMLEAPMAFTFRKVEGTRSGVLEAAEAGQVETYHQRVLNAVRQGCTNGTAISEATGIRREHASRELAAMAQAGVVRNDGTQSRPRYVIPAEQALHP